MNIGAFERQMTAWILTLPYPISANRYWCNFRGRMVVSSEAKQYKRRVAQMAQSAGCFCLDGEIAINLILQPKAKQDGTASRVRMDLDNALKVLLDALQGVAYHNDKQIRRIVAQYSDEAVAGGAVVVRIEQVGKKSNECIET